MAHNDPSDSPPNDPYHTSDPVIEHPKHSSALAQDLTEGSTVSPQSSPFLKAADIHSSDHPYSSKEASPFSGSPPKRPLYRRPWTWAVAILVTAGVIAVVACSATIKPNPNASAKTQSSGSTASAGNTNSTTTPTSPQVAVTTGGDGSQVTKEDGTTFTYKNAFGGFWVSNPADPFDNSAQPNSWTPPLNRSWTWGSDRINGVNLGGLFVLEPFIVPALFQKYPAALDEWTLSEAIAAEGDGALQSALEDHYATFITEEDLAQIAGAGLNWVRLPIPFWAVETWKDVGVDGEGKTVAEPFLARTCWKYILRVLGWARKYGLRVLLDLHTIPGSQNGFNHSGKFGAVNWLNGVMGLANAERSLDYIRTIIEFISQPEYKDLIPVFGIMNEPHGSTVGRDQLKSFYLHAYEMIRNITGTGEGNGPMIAIHDGFGGTSNWADFLHGADRLALDTHPYFAFSGASNRQPVNVTADGGDGTTMGGKWPKQACSSWGDSMEARHVPPLRTSFGVTLAGEFSNAINDCGLYVIGVNDSAQYGPGCEYWEDASQWSDETKAGLRSFALASMDALGDWFFWTWKIGASAAGSVQAPLWSYRLGLTGGWMPTDPRDARGACATFGEVGSALEFTYEPWQTGGGGAGLAESATEGVMPWPPSLLNAPTGASALPQYTRTGTPVTLPPATATASVTASVGSGWAYAQDTGPAVTPIPGCAYPDAWDAVGAQVPVSGCLPAS